MNLGTARLLIGGTHSGAGKTTVATGLMAALAARGLTVQPFKVGPDFIDPGFHTRACGRPGRNLDSWMLSHGTVRTLFGRAMAAADVGIIEGVMGLFDGKTGGSDAGSSAEVARLLAAPVVLVVDAAAMGRSAAAVVAGFAGFDPVLSVAGVIFNRVGGEGHYRILREAMATACPGVACLGYLRGDPALTLPERHLGLVPVYERADLPELYARLTAALAATVFLPPGRARARGGGGGPPGGGPRPPRGAGRRARIAIARDAAFHFYYADGLDLAAALGAEWVPFSPLADAALPSDVDGLYIGGGFPESFAETLAANHTMHESIRRAHAAGLPVYAECGGLMYLARALTGFDGVRREMVGLLPVETSLLRKRLAMGYVYARSCTDHLLASAGEVLRGHEFHYSELTAPSPAAAWQCASFLGGPERPEGIVLPNLLASYVHLHFAANPAAAGRFVAACEACRKRRQSPSSWTSKAE